ncbi:MAG: AMP-binding protein, partial [Desulfobacteraceae bacterium]|nr:AMP-binding protein [Desulfobacteraceae bacterium]
MSDIQEKIPGKTSSLVELLCYRAQYQPDKTGYIFLNDGESDEIRLTYRELDRHARSVAVRLNSIGAAGERALLLYQPGLEYISAFFGCLYAGVTAVPVYPPHPARLERTLPRLKNIAKDAGPFAVMTSSSVLPMAEPFLSKDPDFGNAKWLSTDDIPADEASGWQKSSLAGDSLAFLQYTSGSTGIPKGVMVSHENLLFNLDLIHTCFDNTPESVGVIWLPPYHDMGLIGGILQPIYGGFPVVLMSPVHFLQKPFRWLDAISKYKASASGGPNFAYDLCVRKITAEQLQMIDLSSWEIAFNGSEPIRPETLEQFSEAFGICGFRREAFYPCYGLAEGTLIVSGGLKDEVPVLRDFSSDALTRKKAVLSANDAKDAHTLVGCGKSLPEQKIVIAEPDTLRECKPGETGEIWVLGKSAAQGYWHQPEKTKEVFQACIPDTGEGPFLRTGDLGFLSDGELFVTGRLKDVIILRGRNYYPQDIELTAEKSYYRLRPGCIAAFEVEINNEKRVVIAAEIERRRKERRKMTPAESGYTGKERRRSSNQRVHTELPNYDLENIKPVDTEKAITAIRKAVSEEHELEVYAVLLFKIGAIPKTSSGKIQRHACKEGFLNKTMVPVASSFLEDDYDEIERTDFPDKDRLESLSPDKRQEVLESFLQDIVSIAFKNVLTGDKVNIDDNFFDIGGDSILLVRLHNRLNEVFERDIPITAMFKHPTIKSLAQYLAQDEGKEKTFDFQYVRDRVRKQKEMLKTPNSIAIIGMAGRFPGARNIREFWENLREGKESISFFSDEELIASGVDPAMLKNPGYVRAGGILDDIDKFDAPFFDISPAEARLLDPQLRLFLECAYHTFEHAGYDPKVYPGRIGLFAGSAVNTYLMKNLMNSGLDIAKSWNNDQAIIYSDTNYLTTRTAYTLNFKGPSLSVSTACSTSLVAAHLACQSLMNYECDMALAGGAAVIVPQKEGYLYEGGTRSPDGHCRAFDEKSQGTVFTSGMGSLLLKRLDDALKHGDTVHAVIRGTAVNNDGSARAGYAAPGVDGQTEVIAKAQNIADVDPETITYIEAHGTGTTLGDPIEVEALTHVFRSVTRKKGFCAIGSVKANVGHLNMAAGVTGIIKTALAMKHRMIPPSINFERPNPRIDFDNSPFFVNTTLSEWNPPENTPMRAGVSSFGVGGTNAHVILEQPPNPETEKKSDGSENSLFRTPVPRQHHLLALSAKTDTALEKMTANLAEYFRENPDQDTADVAYTLLTGRRKFGHRRFLVCRDADDAFLKLTGAIPSLFTGDSNYDDRSVIFMFSGQGTQYVNMGLELYQNEPIFRGQVDLCSELLGPHMDFDIRDIMYPGERREAINHQSSIINRQSTIINRQSSIINHQSSIINHQSSIINHQSPIINHQSPIANHQSSIVNHQSINHTAIAQPALFVIEYSLARLWMAWGIRPRAMIGHSIGEYVAACLAGVLTLEDALSLVAYRGKMMGDLPQGGMLAVPLSEEDIRSFLKPGVSLAVINAPSLCVVSGYTEAVDEVKKSLDQKGIQSRRLHTSHAFHSEMTEPVLKPFTEHVRNIQLRPPRIPCISNVTGTWISDEDATDPEYWARHLRQTVRFSDGIRTLTEESDDALLEVGPGQTLTSLAMRQANSKEQSSVVLNSIRHPQDNQSDQIFLMTTLGKLWLAGVKPDWTAFYAQERRRRIPLPEYPFEGRRYWVEPKRQGQIQEAGIRRSDMADWFYAPSWKRVPLSGSAVSGQWSADHPVLIFSDTYGLGEQVSKELKQNGQDVIVVKKGSGFENLNPANFIVNPERPEDYETLVTQLRASGKFPEIILFMWGIGNGQEESKGKSLTEKVDDIIRTGFNGFRFLTQSLGNREQTANIIVVSDNVQEVTGTEELHPEKAMLPGLVRGLPKVCPTLRSRSIDLEEVQNLQFCASQLVSEIRFGASDPVVAYRGPHRWVHSFEPIRLEPVKAKFRQGGTYLI